MARYFINGGINNNWGDTSNWSDTSGGAGGFSVPTASDDVYLDGNSPNCTLNTIDRTCLNLYCTGYANTFAMGTLRLTITGGNMTLNSTMLITGTNTVGLNMNTLGGTITTGGHILQVVLTLAAGLTFTLGDNLNTNSRIRVASTTINSNQINLLDNSQFVVVLNNATCLGSTLINITGNNVSIGADTTSLNSGINIDITINSSGTVTFRQDSNAGGGAFGFGAKTLTYTAGTLVFNCAYIRLVTGGTVTFNMGSQSIPGLLVAVGSVVISLTTDLNVTGTLTLNVNPTINSNTLYCYGISVVTNGNTTGTSNIVLNGTGTWANTGTGYIRNNITINTAGTLTFGTTIRFDTGTLTYTAGTVVSTGNTFISGTSLTLDTDGMSFNNVQFLQSGTITITLSSDLTMTGTLTVGSSGFQITIDGADIYIGGSLTVGGTTSIVQGNASVILNGTGTWSSTQSSTGNFRLNVTLNTAGTITISGNIQYRTGTITYTAGTIITTGSTLNLRANTTLNTNGMTWNDITINFAALTLTINSLLSMSGTLTLGSFDIAMDGTSGFYCSTLSMITALTAARTLTLKSTIEYIVYNSVTITGATNTFRYTIKSSIASSQALFTLSPGVIQNIGYVNGTDIDSSLGDMVYSFNAVLNNTINWNTLTYPKQNNYTY